MQGPPRLTGPVLIILCLAAAGWAFSFGLGATLASPWLRDAGWGYDIFGVNTAIYYAGIALTAVFVPRFMRRWGLGCVTVGCVVSAVSVTLFPWAGSFFYNHSPTVTCAAGVSVRFPWAGSLPWYHLLRFVNGVGAALTLIPLETFVNRDSPAHCRSRNFGFYALAIALGWALGEVVGMEMYRRSPYLAFLLAGVAAALAAGLNQASLSRVVVSEEEHAGPAPVPLRRNLLSFGSGWCQGFLEGGMVGLLPVYLGHLGIPEGRAGWIIGGIMVGVLLFQVPVAWMADRAGRTRILLACYAVTLSGLCFLPYCGDSIWLIVWLFFVGACSSAFYPLGLTLLGERLPRRSVARASAWFLGINCLGSIMGPGITGLAMNGMGEPAMFRIGILAVALVLAGCWLLRRKENLGLQPSLEIQIKPGAAA